MLEPRSRRLLLDTLRPPVGYRFDRAIGTTFTLDLESLLTAPLAFTFFDWEDTEGRPTADPLALLEAVRRHASRIHLFCQAGQIKVPSPDQRLLAYLEHSVIQVRAPHPHGLFHPKVWVVRFAPLDADDPVAYRLVCMSRNLTFSRSWDTTLMLDGVLKNRTRPIRRNTPLGDFVASLAGMAIRPPSPDIRAGIDTIQHEIRRVEFELPEDFTDARFHPMGHAKTKSWPFPDEPRTLLVLAPFVSASFVQRLAETHSIQHLISRPESLAALTAQELAPIGQAWAMSPQADLDSHEGADDDAEPTTARTPASEGDELVGLHAKLFVMDDGWNARVWTGSANATEAAFERNVEFLVELTGRKAKCGIDALLGRPDADEGLRPLLQPFEADDEPPDPKDPVHAELRQRLREATETVLGAAFTVRVEAREEQFDLTVTARTVVRLPPDVSVELWPATLRAAAATPLDAVSSSAVFPQLSIGAVTAFVVFRLAARTDATVEEERFVLLLPISGAPADRLTQILRSLLTNPEQVIRLLLLLLSGEGLRVADIAQPGPGTGTWTAFGALGGSTLLESLLKVLAGNTDALDHVQTLIADLQRTAEGRALLPPGLEQIWEPIWQLRQETKS